MMCAKLGARLFSTRFLLWDVRCNVTLFFKFDD